MTEPSGGEGRAESLAEGMTRAFEASSRVLEQLISTARVDTVFGEPHTVGDRTVIPAAEVMCGLGFGMGGGEGTSPQAPEARGSGGGAGAGGGARGRPVAAIVVGPEGVSVQPIPDATQITLAAISAAVLTLFWVGRLVGKAKAAEEAEREATPRRLIRLLRG